MTGVDALRRYAPGAPPWHAGEGAAALASLQESRRQRLGRLAALLRSFGIDLPLALSSAGPGSLVSILDAWCDAEWPDLAVRDFAWPPRWYARTWQPIEAARHYTLIADVGLARTVRSKARRRTACGERPTATAACREGSARVRGLRRRSTGSA